MEQTETTAWFFGGRERFGVEQDVEVTEVTRQKVAPRVGDEVLVLMRGRVTRVVGVDRTEVEVENLEPVEVVEVRRESRPAGV